MISAWLDNDEEGVMEKGMIFTIEPMFCQGTAVGVQWPDKWTVTTADGGRSAQFEHTVSHALLRPSFRETRACIWTWS